MDGFYKMYDRGDFLISLFFLGDLYGIFCFDKKLKFKNLLWILLWYKLCILWYKLCLNLVRLVFELMKWDWYGVVD